jgi:hypothetical protein
MNFVFCNISYSTRAFDDSNAGCAGLELLGMIGGKITLLGKITFWDATGQFVIELEATEVPLEVLERFIAEAKTAIPTR